MSCVPKGVIDLSLHSKATGAFSIEGVLTAIPLSREYPKCLILSTFLPDFTPQKSTNLTISLHGKFITHSLLSFIYSWDNLSGLIPMAIIGGLVQTVLTQPTVKAFTLSSLFLEVTRTTGVGFNITLPLKLTFFICISFNLY